MFAVNLLRTKTTSSIHTRANSQQDRSKPNYNFAQQDRMTLSSLPASLEQCRQHARFVISKGQHLLSSRPSAHYALIQLIIYIMADTIVINARNKICTADISVFCMARVKLFFTISNHFVSKQSSQNVVNSKLLVLLFVFKNKPCLPKWKIASMAGHLATGGKR